MKVKGKGPEVTNGDSGDAKKVKKSPKKSPKSPKIGKNTKRAMKKKEDKSEFEKEEVPLTRIEEDSGDSDREEEEEVGGEEDRKGGKKKWTNKQRVLILGSRGIGHRDRHLMDDLRDLMPHCRRESKFARGRGESNFAVNELAEMKNCNKCLLFEGRKNRPDLYLWAANVARGPSAKFLVENVHTKGELKMTGNCLKASRPFLSFDKNFDSHPHLVIIKELLIQIFGVPNHHPKSQPFFDHVFTFSVADDRIWFRNFQIVEEDGALAEIGPRFVLNPIKVFEASFSGQTLWDNPKYVTPNSKRSMMKKMKAHKYQANVQAKAAYIASRPKDSTYKVDETEDVFANAEEEEGEKEKTPIQRPMKKRNRKTTAERKDQKAKRPKVNKGMGY